MSTNEKGTGNLKGIWLAALAVLMVCAGLLAFTTSHVNASAPLAAVKGQAVGNSNTGTAPGSQPPQVKNPGIQLSSPAHGSASNTKPAAPAAPNVVLYTQYDNAATSASSSQQFEAANVAFNDQVADDFVVPGGQSWSVNEVDFQGTYYNGTGPATSFNVFFYTNSGTLPATPVYTATTLAFTSSGSGALDFVVPLTTPASLAAGTYWVSVQAVQNFTPSGQFGWQDRTVQSNSPAAFRNPGGGFACSGGNGWVVKTSCIASASPDQVFRLAGTVNAAGTGTATRTSTAGTTSTATRTGTATATAVATTCTVYSVLTTTGTIVSGTVDTGNHGDDVATTINLPFPVQLYGQTYTTAQVGSNGTLSFGTIDNTFTNACLPDATQTFQINPYWDDQETTAGLPGCTAFANGCGVFTATVGTTLYIDYHTVLFANESQAEEYEVVLTQGSSNFSIIYGPGITDSASETIGVQQNSTNFTSYKCNTASPAITPGLRLNFTLAPCATATVTNTVGPTNTSTVTTTGTPPTATATCAVPQPGTWTAQAAYPIAILDEAATSLNGTLYSFSGVSGGALVASSYKYNPGTNTWTAIAALPAARENASAVTDGTYIYILGGADSTGAVTTTLYRYDPAANTYTTMAPYTVGTFAQAAAYANGKIYRISGCTTPCSAVTNTVEAYTVSSNTWATVAAYPQAYGFIQAVGSGNNVYAVGGTDTTGTASTKTYRYDTTANTWDDASVTDLPVGNWGGVLGVLNGRLALATGYQGAAVGNAAYALSLSNTAGAWVTLPNALQTVGRDGGGVVGSSLYVIGGRDASGGFNGTNYNQQYTEAGCTAGTVTATVAATLTADPTPTTSGASATPTCLPGIGSWSAGANLPTLLVRAVGVYFPANGKFYTMGGRSGDAAGSDVQTPYEYTPGSNTWVTKAGMIPDNQVNNMACGVLTVSGTAQIYCVGGSAAGATTTTARVFSYNPVTDTMTALPAGDNWPGDSSGTILPGGFAVANNKLYIVGGFNINVASTNQIWQFDPTAASGSRWTQKVNAPVGVMYAPTASYNGNIYVLGASDYDGTTVIDTNETFMFNPTTNTIDTTIATIPRATGETRALNVGGKLWVLGGGRTAPNPSNEVDIYDPVANTWSTGAPFTTPRRNFPADTDGTKIYLAGGYDASGTTLLQDMEIFQPGGCNNPTSTATVTVAATVTTAPTATCPPLAPIVLGPNNEPVAKHPAAKTAPSKLKLSGSGRKGGTAGAKSGSPLAPVTFLLDDGTYEDSVGFGNGSTEFASVWINRFTPLAGSYPLTIQTVSIEWPTLTTDTLVGKSMRILVYVDADGDGDPSNAVLVSQSDVTVTALDTFIDYPVTAVIPSGDLYVGFYDSFADPSYSPELYPAAIDENSGTQNRSYVAGMSAAAPADYVNLGNNDLIGTIEDLSGGSLSGNWLIRASGQTNLGGSCPSATVTSTASATSASTNTATSTTQPVASVTGTTQPVASATRSATTAPAASATSTMSPTACPIQFTDVPSSGSGSTFYVYARCLVCRGIVSGYPCGGAGEPCDANHNPYYRPGANVTRGQLSKIISNSAGLSNTIPATQQSFSDVPPSTSPSSFWVYIERLAGTGAISGYPCNSTNPQTGAFLPCDNANRPYFLPTNNATRGQISKIVAIAAGFTEPVSGQTFSDVPPTSPFYQYIQRLSNRHIIDGYDAASGRCAANNPPYAAPCFLYNTFTTRGQMAKIAANAFFPNCQTRIKPDTAEMTNR